MRQVGGMTERGDPGAAAAFEGGLARLAAGQDRVRAMRPELSFEDVPAPRTLAPFAAAIAATAEVADCEVGSGTFVLLYDPAGQPGWAGPIRIIVHILAELDPEIAADPLLGEVGWSWLTEALDNRTDGYAEPSGTVTRVVTEGFGAKRDESPATSFELRASWSPAGPPGAGRTGPEQADLAGHLAAWCGALCAASGLPPLAAGVTALRQPGTRWRQ